MSSNATNCNAPLDATQICKDYLHFDGDIAGIGVRLSFYLQTSFLVWLVNQSSEEAEGSLWTFIATSFGLTIAALVQVRSRGLTLLEGILVSQLSWLANLGTILALASYSRSKGKDNLVKFAAVLQGYFSMFLTLFLWGFAPNLPGGSGCGDLVKFVVMYGKSLPATGSGRVVALVFSSLIFVLYTIITFTECRAWMKTGKSRLAQKEKEKSIDAELGIPSMSEPAQMVQRLRGGAKTRNHGISRSYRRKYKPRQPWTGTDVDPISPGILIAQAIVFSYFIATTETMINQHDAKVSDDNNWGFGQVLALAVVIPPAISLMRALQKKRMAKLAKEKSSRNSPRAGASSSSRGPHFQISGVPLGPQSPRFPAPIAQGRTQRPSLSHSHPEFTVPFHVSEISRSTSSTVT